MHEPQRMSNTLTWQIKNMHSEEQPGSPEANRSLPRLRSQGIQIGLRDGALAKPEAKT
jgi:hypothetical protein